MTDESHPGPDLDPDWLRLAVEAVDEHAVAEVAAKALATTDVTACSWSLARLPGTGGGTFASVVYRMTGDAIVGSDRAPWSAIVKVAQRRDEQQPSDHQYWRRETELYGSNWCRGRLPDGLSVPACYGSIELAASSILFLEDLGPDDRAGRTFAWYGRLARLLGQMNGMAHDCAEQPTWLSRDFVGGEARFASTLVNRLHHTPSNPVSSRLYTPQNRSDFIRIIDRSEHILDALGRIPGGFSHLDAFSRNVIQRGDDCVLFDWSLTGNAPIGADLAGLFLLTAIHIDVDVDDIAEFEAVLFESYLNGLADGGNPIDAADLRFAFVAATVLRHLGFVTGAQPVFENDLSFVESLAGRPLDEIVDALLKLWDHVHRMATEVDHYLNRSDP